MSANYAEGLSPYEHKGKLGLPEQFDTADAVADKVATLATWIKEARHVVFHTGAGISTSAGIPDFRGPRGVWTLEERGERPDSLSWDDAEPTATHMALAGLVERDLVKFVVSQNIDGLHLRSGLPRTALAELHGNMFVDQCDKCRKMFVRSSPATTVGQKATGELCPGSRSNGRRCRGKLHDFVLDWEAALPDDDMDLSDAHATQADLSIVLGSTLQIIPAGNLPTYAKKYNKKGRLVICNLQPTKHDKKADLLIRTFVDDIMTMLLDKLGIELPSYSRDSDPVKRRAEVPSSEYIDWTQCPEEVKTMKRQGGETHDRYLKQRREEKLKNGKRKSELVGGSDDDRKLVKAEPAKKKLVKEEEIKVEEPDTSVSLGSASNSEDSSELSSSVKVERKDLPAQSGPDSPDSPENCVKSSLDESVDRSPQPIAVTV